MPTWQSMAKLAPKAALGKWRWDSSSLARPTSLLKHPPDGVRKTTSSAMVQDWSLRLPGIAISASFDFGLGLVTLAGATADGDMFAPSWSTVDFGHTLTWGGIDRITDADGNELSGVTFTTASNFDFYAPAIAPAIPEPQTWVMMLAGFGLIGALARKRHLAMR